MSVPKLWLPRQVLVGRDALRCQRGRAIVDRASKLGCRIIELKANRLTGMRGGTAREEYVRLHPSSAPTASKFMPNELAKPTPRKRNWPTSSWSQPRCALVPPLLTARMPFSRLRKY